MAAKPSDRRPRPKVTGLRMPPELVKEMKHMAVDSDKTLRECIIEAVREYIAKYRRK